MSTGTWNPESRFLIVGGRRCLDLKRGRAWVELEEMHHIVLWKMTKGKGQNTSLIHFRRFGRTGLRHYVTLCILAWSWWSGVLCLHWGYVDWKVLSRHFELLEMFLLLCFEVFESAFSLCGERSRVGDDDTSFLLWIWR
jgi:hypothetical protein